MLKYEPVCSWIGNGEGCTNPSVPNKSYCEEHVWIVYNKGTGPPQELSEQLAADGSCDLYAPRVTKASLSN